MNQKIKIIKSYFLVFLFLENTENEFIVNFELFLNNKTKSQYIINFQCFYFLKIKNKKSNQTYFYNSNLLKIKTIFKK